MAIGNRRPISFLGPTIVPAEGGSGTTTYDPIWDDYAIPKQVKSDRNITEDQTSLDKLYKFDEIRQTTEFTPTKSMLILYNGRECVIQSIILQENIPPYYYTITAGYNEQE